MDENKSAKLQFQEWTVTKYKRNIAFQLNKALENVNSFLRDTEHLPHSITDLSSDIAIQHINSLNQNRLFRNTYKESMPLLSKLGKAVSEFISEVPPDKVPAVSGIVPDILSEQSDDEIDSVKKATEALTSNDQSSGNKKQDSSGYVLAYINTEKKKKPVIPEGKKTKVIVERKSVQTTKNSRGYFPSASPRIHKSAAENTDRKKASQSPFLIASVKKPENPPKQAGVASSETELRRPGAVNKRAENQLKKEKDVFRAVKKCKILLDGMVISEENILRSYLNYLSETSEKGAHNIGFILHTGSVVFDALAVFWAVVKSYILNSTDADEVVRSLERGDLVIYKGSERYRFDRIEVIDNDEYAVLQKDDKSNSRLKVLSSKWNRILPYLGDATSLDNRGIKPGNLVRDRFFSKILGVPVQDIPSVCDTSVVFVMSKEKVDRIIKSLSISFYGDTIDLLDLVTASYYTDNDEVRYRGNTGRNEPVLKFTSKISTGRKLLLQKHGNHHHGLFICDDEIIRKSQSELPELMNRKSIPCIFTTACIDSETAFELLDAQDDASAFACTKDFLLSTPLDIKEKNEYTEELFHQIDSIVDHDTSYYLQDGFIDKNTYREFRRSLFSIRNSDYRTNELDDFIIDSWTLFNLFQTMPFSIKALEDNINDGNIPLALPSDRLQKLKTLELQFPELITERTHYIISTLESSYHALKDISKYYQHKEYALDKLITENARKKICVVVPKAYYEIILRSSRAVQFASFRGNIEIVTANRFDNAYHFDLIICLGNYTGTRFDCFKCMSAPTIITLLYDFERNIWISRRKKAASFVRLINKRACIPVMEDEEVDQLYAEEDEEEPVQEIAQRIEDTEYYFNRLRARLPELQSYTRNSDVTSKETDIAAVVTFETGEKAFLTPYYEACVYIEKDGVVKEVHINADDLLEGDYMVFTRNDSMMHDIVDDILTMLINNNKLSEDDIVDYNRSKTWKNRLRAYKKLSHYTSGDITERLEKNGVSVTEQTVRIWTDPEAHTVGPRDLKVIRAIGKITSDSEMMTHPEITMNSCRRIRQLRRSILEIIGNTVMDILSGKNMKFIDSSEEEIQSRIRTQADIMRIESFVRVSNKVPSAFVNRPISL